MKVDDNGNVFVVGTNISGTNGKRDILVSSYDNSGKLNWSKTAGGSYNEVGSVISIGENNDIIISGSYGDVLYDLESYEMNFDSLVHLRANRKDVFVAKINAPVYFEYGNCTNKPTYLVTNLNHENIILYPNPTLGSVNVLLEKTYPLVEIKIFNLMGNLVQNERFEEVGEISLNLNFQKGLYIFEIIIMNKRTVNYKVVIN